MKNPGILAISLSLILWGVTASSSAPAPLASQPFRDEHRVLRQRLEKISTQVGQLAGTPRPTQRASMREMVDFFKGEIEPHAKHEEAGLYQAVDRRASDPSVPFTSTMRNEHRIIGRSIEELRAMAEDPKADAGVFARKADRLLGLLSAHFESEEQVLLPILDRSMSPGEFKREVMARPHSH